MVSKGASIAHLRYYISLTVGGTPGSAWAVLNPIRIEIIPMMNGMPLPTLDLDRGAALRSTWQDGTAI
jgi:hypothetical protein